MNTPQFVRGRIHGCEEANPWYDHDDRYITPDSPGSERGYRPSLNPPGRYPPRAPGHHDHHPSAAREILSNSNMSVNLCFVNCNFFLVNCSCN